MQQQQQQPNPQQAPPPNGAQNTALAHQPQSQSERFTNAVMREFSTNAGSVQTTAFQKKLIQNYFIKLDLILKTNEVKRLGTKEEYRDPLEFSWNNVNMKQLALDVVAYSSIGLDPLQPNHINLIPYKNSKTNLFDIGFIIGYDGIELKARKYGYNAPDNVIVELVKKNDNFKPIKKDKNNPIETYTFDIGNGFDRGEIIGGFYFHEYLKNPEKNKLEIFTLADIEKRKPKYASAEFWGENKKKVGTEKVEGWFEEMCWKTIKRAAYNDIPIDSEKIDEHLVRMLQAPVEGDFRNNVDAKVTYEIQANANQKELAMDTEAEDVTDRQAPATTEQQTSEAGQPAANGNGALFNNTKNGPDF